jgi:hypothetical protein
MSNVTVGQQNNADIEIYYEDHGTGHPDEVNIALLELVGD